MVRTPEPEYQYSLASEGEIDELLAGRPVSNSIAIGDNFRLPTPKPGDAGVVWSQGDEFSPNVARPLALVVRDEDIRRLCGRYAQLRGDLSPISTWCHLLTPRFSSPLDAFFRKPSLGGMEAAWTGLVIAEASLLADRRVSSVRIPACLATQTFAIARVNSMWTGVSVDEILKKFDLANQIFRNASTEQRDGSRARGLRSSLLPIWTVLIGGIVPELPQRSEYGPIVDALRSLRDARLGGATDQGHRLAEPLKCVVPQAEALDKLEELTPEARLKIFDQFVALLDNTSEKLLAQRASLALLAGYVATVAAGGAPSLALAEQHVSRYPEITAWAYVVGSVGEQIVWTSSFDGLGRLVAREFLRPLKLDEPPVCDFALEEVAVLADASLSDPLVHLKVKQARLVTVALFPGVNVAVPLSDSTGTSSARYDHPRHHRVADSPSREPMATLADALWPYLQAHLDSYLGAKERKQPKPQRARGKKKGAPQTQLTLANEQKDEHTP